MTLIRRAEPKLDRLPTRGDRGALFIELAVAAVFFVGLGFGVLSINNALKARRTLERGIGEAMLLHAVEGDIVAGPEAAALTFTFPLGNESSDGSQLASCDRSIGSRCRIAGDAALRIARVARASDTQPFNTVLMDQITVTLRYDELNFDPASPYTIPNGLVTITVDATLKRSVTQTTTVSRSESVG